MENSAFAFSSKNKRVLNLASLYEISKVLGATLNKDKLFNLILSKIMQQTNADSGSLMLFNENTQELSICAYQGLTDKIAEKTKIKLGQGIAGIVAQQKKPLLIDDKNFFSISGKKPHRKIKSALSIPLIFSDSLIGVINLNRVAFTKEFMEEDLDAISIFVKESAVAIHNAQMYIAAEEKIQHLFRFNVISCALNSAFSKERIINLLGECVRELFSFDLYTLLILEKNDYYLLITSRSPLPEKMKNFLKKNISLVVSSLKKEKVSPKRINCSIIKIKNGLRKHLYPRDLNSVLHAPLIMKGNILGMLSLYSVKKNGFTQKDQQSLTTLANQTAIALENANLYKSLRHTYLSTIKALAQAIEEKDPYTRGHSDLVSHYSVAIAQALKLPSTFIEAIQIAGILHDIGKIGIPEKILSKPDRLTEEEFKIIKEHPKIGRRILSSVDFFWGEIGNPGRATNREQFKRYLDQDAFLKFKVNLDLTMDILKPADLSAEIKTMIYHHHERYDGGGYPEGLSGEKIPLGSRILAVADTFEAMTANRPYRKAFSENKALKLLKECSGNQLDSKIVSIFLKLNKNRKISNKISEIKL